MSYTDMTTEDLNALDDLASAAVRRLYERGINVAKTRQRYESRYGSQNLKTNVMRALKRNELDF